MTVTERLMGIETEYAIAALSQRGESIDRQVLVPELLCAAGRVIPNLHDHFNGMFLQNGSRFYIDTGHHPEVATPECTNPSELVSYVLAGEEMLRTVAGSLEHCLPDVREVRVFRSNVDYGGTHSTWGCHESFLHRADPSVIGAQIVPHLVSRIVYTGAGGFNPLAEGLEFSLSPRVAHLTSVVSGESTRNRGIFHTKNETLAREGYNRLHIICGESLYSQIASWLKTGATAIVVAMIEAGVCRAEAVQLRSPLIAMQSFAADPRCAAAAALANGGSATAIEIQRHYLARAEANLGRDFMPGWTERVCREWRRILDQLENAPASVDTCLDWAIKYSVFRDRTRRHGMVWETLPHWNDVMAGLKKAGDATGHRELPVSPESVPGSRRPVQGTFKELAPYLEQAGLRREDLARFNHLKRELFEIDMRFAQLGGNGIFASLEKAGVLSHGLPDKADVKAAMADPPACGRARLRGNFVRRHASENGRYLCDWHAIWDYGGNRILDLSDPFESEERWHDFTGADAGLGPESWGLRSAHRRFRTR